MDTECWRLVGVLTSLHVMTLSNGQIDCRQESQTGEQGGGGGDEREQ